MTVCLGSEPRLSTQQVETVQPQIKIYVINLLIFIAVIFYGEVDTHLSDFQPARISCGNQRWKTFCSH